VRSKLANLAGALVAALSLASGGSAASLLYATGGGGLFVVDASSGASTKVFDFPGVDLNSGGLAYDAASDSFFATGSEFASSGTTRLFRIDRTSGAVTEIGPVGAGLNLSAGGLAIHPLTGALYATGTNGFQSSALFTLDKTTGAATLVGQNGGQCCTAPFGFNMYGLGFRSDGTLFANGFTLSESAAAYSHLFTIDLLTGAATDIGSHGVTLGRLLAYSGLAFREDGVLLSLGSVTASDQGLYAIDPATGVASLLGLNSQNFGVDGGLAFAPVPEPGSLALLGALLVGAAGRRAIVQRGH
jgi:hypothetical protein